MNAAQERLKFWRPRQLSQVELLQGTSVTNPCCQQFAQSYVIGTIQSGRGILQYRNTSQELTRGAFYVIEPEEVWSCQAEALTFSHLIVDPTWLQHLAAEWVGVEKRWSHERGPGLHDRSLGLFFEQLFARFTVPASRLEQEDLLLQVLTQVLLDRRVARGAPGYLEREHPSIERVKAYLAEHYAEEVSLETLAHIAHLSPFHLARLFRQVVGLPPHAYQIQVRLSHARKLLAQGCSVSSVAQETGFFDQTHLSKQFKQHFGVTPGIYRKTARFY
jgi:AraC-like DNA-binding protein